MSGYLPQKTNTDLWVRVDVRGKDKVLWAGLREKLVVRINALLDSTLDYERGTSVREEAKEFTSALLDFARAKIAKAGLEAEKIAAEVSKTFAEKQKELARAEKLCEEAREIRIKNDIRELRITLGGTKAMLVGDASDEALLFGKQVEAFLSVLKEIE